MRPQARCATQRATVARYAPRFDLAALTPEERDAATGGEVIRYTAPKREPEAQLTRTFLMLHRADGTVTHPPTDAYMTHALANFGYVIWVSEGRSGPIIALGDVGRVAGRRPARRGGESPGTRS
jgi:hypothetical protein